MSKNIVFYVLVIACFSCTNDYTLVNSDKIKCIDYEIHTLFLDENNRRLNGFYRIFRSGNGFGGVWQSELIEGLFLDGKLDGTIKIYNKNPNYKQKVNKWGLPKAEKTPEDLVKQYSKIHKIINFKDGILDGECIIYSEELEPKAIANYERGVLDDITYDGKVKDVESSKKITELFKIKLNNSKLNNN